MKLIYLHSLVAIPTILCVFIPLFALSLKKQTADGVAKKAQKMVSYLRIPNFLLFVSLITGLLQVGLTFNSWVLTVLVLFLGISALLGITSKTLKNISELASQNENYQAQISKLMKVSIPLSVLIVAMVLFKTLP
ncbi:hypothetical protein ACQCN2_14400 [Brevibacillus ginsengisoli]|uniref:hypothetical protein n=1 Tax=Brevibacillus ginsengisoli TaxID=363854 RepID=UPI003CEC2651